MCPIVNLLLVLSALLSALTGAGGYARAPAAPVAVSVQERVLAVIAARRVPAARPAQPLPRIAAVAPMTGTAWRLVPAEPPYASRRRE